MIQFATAKTDEGITSVVVQEFGLYHMVDETREPNIGAWEGGEADPLSKWDMIRFNLFYSWRS